MMKLLLNRRLLMSRVALVGIALMSMLVASPFYPGTMGEHGGLHEAISLGLVMVAAFGRIWATMYLGGRKNAVLVREGPYSLCRNPLYLFTAIGVAGIAIQSHQPWVAGALLAFMAVFYPWTIRNEERLLEAKFGRAFHEYRTETPAFFPAPGGFRAGGETVEVNPRFVLKAVFDNMWWIIGWYLLGAIEEWHVDNR